jgi:hypothetical protein
MQKVTGRRPNSLPTFTKDEKVDISLTSLPITIFCMYIMFYKFFYRFEICIKFQRIFLVANWKANRAKQ